MKQILIYFLAFVSAGLIAGCWSDNKNGMDTSKSNTVIFDSIAIKKIIVEKTNKFTQSHVTKDTGFLNNIFTKNAKVYAPNSDVVIGRTAISALNAEWVNFGIKEFSEVSTDFYGNEDFIVDEGNYNLRFGESEIIDKGKYINIWKKENGDWKIYSNIWNTSLPQTMEKIEK